MSIKSDLRREGIEVVRQLKTINVNLIATSISKKIVNRFPEQNFNYYDLCSKLSKLNMYIAKMPKGIAAKYFYKNSSIYFSETTDLLNLSDVVIHECIHCLQSKIDAKKNKLIRLGLCDFTDPNLSGIGLNEAAVQLMTMRTTKSKFDTVKYFNIDLPSNSPDYYTLECNLVRQMAYITGEYVLYNSTLYGNDNFKNKFISLTSEKAFETIKNNINSILYLEEELNNVTEKIQNSNNVSIMLLRKSTKLRNAIKKQFLTTQNKIFTSFFDNMSKYSSIQQLRQTLYNYRKIIGVTDDYTFFNEYYINKISELESKCNNVLDNELSLIPIKNSLIDKVVRSIKTLIGLNKNYSYDYNNFNM